MIVGVTEEDSHEDVLRQARLTAVHIDFAPELEAFREEVAAFLDTAPTPAIREAGRKLTSAFASFDEVMEWQAILNRKGWAAPAWPVEFGGPGWSVEQRFIFAEEYCARDLPPLLPNCLQMVGPLLMEAWNAGTAGEVPAENPCRRGLLDSRLFRAQLRVRTSHRSVVPRWPTATTTSSTAARSGRRWPTGRTGCSCWCAPVERERSSGASPFCFSTGPTIPGMTIRPIVGLDGFPEQCEVFFDDVRVPQSGRVGEENDGWTVAKALLKHERGGARRRVRSCAAGCV